MRLDPPLDPTSPEARQWLEDELRKGIYHEQKGLLQRFWDWLNDSLGSSGGTGFPAWTIWIAVVIGVAVVALVVLRSLRAERRMTGPRRAGVLDGPTRSAAEHRTAARDALARGDADTAVLEAYRAIARSAEERTLLDDLPGRTAHEVAVALGPVFPASASLAGHRRRHLRRGALRPAHGRRGVGPRRHRARRHPRVEPAGAARPGHRGGPAMSAAVTETEPAPPAARPTARWGRDRVRRTAAYVGAVALGLLLVVMLALSAQRPTAPLDPDGTGPEGARALAEVLRSQGVEVEVVRSIDALEATDPDAGTTVVVGDPTDLGPGAAQRLAASARLAGRLVLVGLDTEQLADLGLSVQAFPGGGGDLVARCRSEVARTADVVTAWDTRYLPAGDSAGARTCFVLPSPDGAPDQPDPDGAYGAAMVQLDATAAHPETRAHRVRARRGPTTSSPRPATPAPRCGRSARRHDWSGTSPAPATRWPPAPVGWARAATARSGRCGPGR